MFIFLFLPSCLPGFAEIIWNYRYSLLLNLFLHNISCYKNPFLQTALVCNNHVISNYLDLSFTGFIAHHYVLYTTSSPICIFWSNFVWLGCFL